MIHYSAIKGRWLHKRSPIPNIARPYFHRLTGIRSHDVAGGFQPPALATHYNFPDVDGTGQNIALIELGGGVDIPSLAPYWAQIGVAAPKIVLFEFDGGTNTTGGDADGEVCGDICVSGGLAPGAQISVVFAQNTDQDFYGAVTYAVDTPVGATIISISWGGP